MSFFVSNKRHLWSAWTSLKTYHQKPSSTLELTDTIAIYCLDNAVIWFGMTVENALQERVNEGSEEKPKWEAKYTLGQLLDPLFRMPKPEPAPKPKRAAQSGFAAMMALASQAGSGVKAYKYVKPS